MSDMLGFSMRMKVKARCQATVFLDFLTSEECSGLVVYLVSGLIISILFELLVSIRSKLYNRISSREISYFILKERLILSGFYFGIVFLSFIQMFFLMSYNLWIILSVLIGNIVGFIFFGLDKVERKKRLESLSGISENQDISFN